MHRNELAERVDQLAGSARELAAELRRDAWRARGMSEAESLALATVLDDEADGLVERMAAACDADGETSGARESRVRLETLAAQDRELAAVRDGTAGRRQ